MEKILTLKPYSHGQFKDGRQYQIISIPQITINKNGELKYGDVELEIYNDRGSLKSQNTIMRISEFLSIVANVGDLFV